MVSATNHKLNGRDSLKDCPFHVRNFIGSQVALEKEKGLPLSQRLTKLDENLEMVDAGEGVNNVNNDSETTDKGEDSDIASQVDIYYMRKSAKKLLLELLKENLIFLMKAHMVYTLMVKVLKINL